ncbi:MAG: TRAP transporter small permease [Flavobacteriaceae bacterium]|nr:TRAP transporter small permease [Flavobacteriaceae bacterium]MDG1291182.1 TRAP transporter small permease [Flavobacteriaceae bacterium]
MNVRAQIDSILEKTLIVIMSFMVVNVLWQVFSRYILANPSSFTDELARYLMIWVGVLGAAYVAGKGNHVAITYFSEKLNPVNLKRVQIIINLTILSFAILGMFIGGVRLVYITLVLEQLSPALKIPLGVVYAVIPLSGLLIIFYKVLDLKEQAQ